MAPPVAVYVVAAVVGVAAIVAFKEFVYEAHIAPTVEAWAEDFLERRRAARNRRASAVPVNTSRRHRNSTSSSDSSHHDNDLQGDRGGGNRAQAHNDSAVDGFELEALASREVDEWRNEVLRSQQKDGLRRRRTDRIRDDFDGFDSTSTTLDESFTSLTHTPHAYVISNMSSPNTPSTVSLPERPTRRHRSESQSTATQRGASTVLVDLHSPPSPIHEISASSSRSTSPISADLVSYSRVDITCPTPLAISNAVNRSPAHEVAPRPLPFTPTYQIMVDDSPFGPLLPDTPRSSAEMYGERPFSPITRVMGSSSSVVSASGSTRTYSSRANSMSSIRTLGGSGVFRKSSGLVNEVVPNGPDDGNDEEHHPHASTSTFTLTNPSLGTNESVISSLSERYPAPPTPPVIISPPASSVGVISAPSSPRSGGSEAAISEDAVSAFPRSPSQPVSRTHPSVPLLQLPPDSPSPRQLSQSRSQTYTATSPALSYASFLSPMPLSRAASESEGDEFLSVASYDSDWSVSPVTPGGHVEPMQDRENNPFLDFVGSEHGEGSEGSEVVVSDVGHEGESEVGSDESWGSARRH